jgi:hypothetical protein
MIKNLQEKQKNSKNADFAKRLTAALRNSSVEPYPAHEYFNRDWHPMVSKLNPS